MVRGISSFAILLLAAFSATASPPRQPPPHWWVATCGNISTAGVGGADTAPVLVHRVMPKLSEAPRRSTLVILETVIDVSGNVCAARVLKASSSAAGRKWAELSLAAVRQWRFRPALKKGKPVAAVFTLSINGEVY